MQSESLREYKTLEHVGLLEQLQDFQTKAHDYEELISQSLEMFTKTSEEELVAHLSSCLMQRFIPSYLVVFLHQDETDDTVNSICFQNLRPARCPVCVEDFEPYREYFGELPAAVDYSRMLEEAPQCAEKLKPLLPDIIIPLNGLTGLYGFVVLGKKVLEDEYSQEERTYIQMLFEYASIGLQNVIHYTSSVTDFKTRLYNHAFFLRRLREEMNRVGRYHSSFALLAIDIDHFKQVNDRHGHLAGDRILFQLARAIEESVREEDIVSRYGGEEFLVLLTQCSKRSAYIAAERIRQSVEKMSVQYHHLDLKITISIGSTHCTHPLKSNPTQLIKEADQALYRAKNNGRNRCELVAPGLLMVAHKLQESLQAVPFQ
ncbi:MAG: GGDEF domain-containing protein [Spirochaetaceae bacterium]|nr:MAG: GGDEF domain-containing protein [Spirochaetaceae bacterium]